MKPLAHNRGVTVTFESLCPEPRMGWAVFTLPAALGEGKIEFGGEIMTAHSGARRGTVNEWHVRIGMTGHDRRTLKGQLFSPHETADRPTVAPSTLPVAALAEVAENLLDPAELGLQVATSSTWVDVPLRVVSVDQQGPAVDVEARGVYGGRTFTMFGRMWPDQHGLGDVLEVEVHAVWSDRTVPALNSNQPEIRLVSRQPHAVLWQGARGAKQAEPGKTTLAPVSVWGDTQGQAWRAYVALRPNADSAAYIHGPILAVASADDWDGGWGPFGKVPVLSPAFGGVPAHFRDVVDAATRLNKVTTGATIWDAPRLGLRPNSGQTGGQQDFGVTKLARCWRVPYGTPAHLNEALQAALQECCRPGDWRNPDGAVAEPWDHPNHVTWDGGTHWSSSVSSDRMGKMLGEMRPSGGWRGPDREHWSNNGLCGTYLLTGSPVLRTQIEKQARLFLRGETIDRRLSTSNAGAPRGVGRTMLAAAWIDCCLDESMLRTEFRRRVCQRLVNVIEPQTRAAEGVPVVHVGTMNDPRAMPVECWAPWQVGLFIVGIAAIRERISDWIEQDTSGAIDYRLLLQAFEECSRILARTCPSWIEFGWWKFSQGGAWQLADYVATCGTEAPTVDKAVRREGFEEWMGGAVRVSLLWCLDEGTLRKVDEILEGEAASSIEAVEWGAV